MATDSSITALAELQAWPHWVVWRTEERNGRTTKVPYTPHRRGQRASSTDPATWGTYDEACHARDNGQGVGVGYVFSPTDEYTGVDLDKCIEPAEGAFGAALGPTIREGARRFVTELDSYTELSPTGTGLHIIVRGRINGSRNRTGKTPWGGEFEFYDQARFFTITGEHLTGTPTTIESRQDQLDRIAEELFPQGSPTANPALLNGNGHGPLLVPASTAPTVDDIALEQKIRASKQGAKFAELFDRGAGENGGASEADLGLCNILAFWLGPHETDIDRWFRRSALMRDKWDEKRGDTTYGGYTINRALEGRTEFYGRPKSSSSSSTARPADDDVELSPGEEMSRICGLIDDPFTNGMRLGRQAKSRVVLTTRSGRVLDLESWKAATTSARALSQEIRMQLGVDVTLDKDGLSRMDVLVGKFCALVQTATIHDRAREFGEALLQAAEKLPFEMDDQASRADAFRRLQERHPSTRAKAEGLSLGEAILVLEDVVTGKRYVRVQWFVDFVKANAVSSTVPAILEQIEVPGWWSRPNASGKFKATDPATGKPIYHRLFEVPADWEHDR